MKDIFDQISDSGSGDIFDKIENKPMTWSDVGQQAFSNLPSSAMQFGKSMVEPIIDPVNTAKSIGKLALGAAQLLIPGIQGYEENAEAVGQFFKDRYGGYENVKRTIAKDPVGFVTDLGSAISGAGVVMKGAGTISSLSKLSKAGETAKWIGQKLEPITLAKQSLKVIPEAAETRLYSSAIKGLTHPKTSWAEKQETLKKGIELGVMPTEKGLTKLSTKIEQYNQIFDQKIRQGARQGNLIDAQDVLNYLDGTEEFFSHAPSPGADLAAIRKLKEDFLASHGLEVGGKSTVQKYNVKVDTGLVDSSGNPILREVEKNKIVNAPGRIKIPEEEALQIKRTAYAKYKDAYGELSTALKEANKDVARGVKEELIKLHPELRKIGEEERVMINLEKAIEAGLKRSQNYDIGRFPGLIAGGAAGAVTESPKIAVAIWATKALMDTPSIKAALSVALNRAKKHPRFMSPVRQMQYQLGRMGELEQEPERPVIRGSGILGGE